MGFPFSDDAVIGQPTIDRVSRFLRKHHAGRFMIWNISEQQYDYSKFDDNVIEFKFPGYPSPPLHQIFSICDAIDSWLRADEKNVAAIHCQTGTGRTYTLMSCYLAWMRQFHTPQKALAHILRARHAALSESMIPSQMRYQFTNFLLCYFISL
jgi:tensin